MRASMTQGSRPKSRPGIKERLGGIGLNLLLMSFLMLGGCESLSIQDTESLLSPTLKRSEVVGLVAGLGTTFAALPDLIAMLRRRSTAGMNPRMAGIMGVFQVAWVYYGLLIASRPVIIWNAVGIVINALNVGAYRYFRRRERRQVNQA
jgi:MtN3 and saliva related transmembrane protein